VDAGKATENASWTWAAKVSCVARVRNGVHSRGLELHALVLDYGVLARAVRERAARDNARDVRQEPEEDDPGLAPPR